MTLGIPFFLDRFTLALVAVVAAASLVPAQGPGAVFFHGLTTAAIALLFFLHGAKLSRQAIIAGAMHWRLHLLIFAWTFIVFPILGWVTYPVLVPLLGPGLAAGVIYLCVLPGTVQSAIAFTSMARGNIPAAVCAASASSIVGIIITPVLLQLILGADTAALGGGALLTSIWKISVQILLPFAVGHLMRPLLVGFLGQHRLLVGAVDRGSILLVVYTAFSQSVIGGLWKSTSLGALAWLVVVCCVLLALVLAGNMWSTRRLGFNRADEIAIVFCGSKKSLATGVPMAGVLFGAAVIGPMLLPLMIFHQVQLMVCAALAQHYPHPDTPKLAPGAAA